MPPAHASNSIYIVSTIVIDNDNDCYPMFDFGIAPMWHG
jgi:hypothetical protein